ncbi:MAG: hypothetical protein K6T66_09185 [Peptococcaceae bacterium]|nr:hypothetical protein [Peptococcaceae bacterium]
MAKLLGWAGFLLLAGTLLPFVLRRLRLPGVKFFARCHHKLAIASLAALTLHGFLALSGKRGWQWGKLAHLKGDILTGVISWSVMLAVVALALLATRKKPFSRTHCWLVGVLVVLVLFHVL